MIDNKQRSPSSIGPLRPWLSVWKQFEHAWPEPSRCHADWVAAAVPPLMDRSPTRVPTITDPIHSSTAGQAHVANAHALDFLSLDPNTVFVCFRACIQLKYFLGISVLPWTACRYQAQSGLGSRLTNPYQLFLTNPRISGFHYGFLSLGWILRVI